MSDVTAVMGLRGEEPQLVLPRGFRFHPTDEEVVTYYLTPKISNSYSSVLVVPDVNINNTEPWDLPSKCSATSIVLDNLQVWEVGRSWPVGFSAGLAKMGEKEWFFFVHKDRKYPTGTRTNRATRSGYWKATGKDKEIYRGKGRGAVLIGMKKTLVFYLGRAPSGQKTSWVMHEYRLEGQLPHRLPRSAKDDWAVCRLFNKDSAANNAPQMAPAADGGMEEEDPFAFLDEIFNSDDLLNNADLPILMDSPSGAVDFAGAPAPQQ
ncbi:hypothetical protein ZWY2020_010071 [Hordeum vulgare]|nr:hypothetical protein ZWY2020_010071 [Hordeum vulgare]